MMANRNRTTGSMPFVQANGGGPSKPAWTRIIEAVLIAGLTAFATSYANQKVMQAELVNIKMDIGEIRAEQKQIRRDLYIPRPARNN